MPRNEFLFTNANYLLPYTGAGTGIIHVMEEKPDVTFESHETAHEFVIISVEKSVQGCLRDRCMTFLNKKTMATSEKTPAGWN